MRRCWFIWALHYILVLVFDILQHHTYAVQVYIVQMCSALSKAIFSIGNLIALIHARYDEWRIEIKNILYECFKRCV